MEPDPYELGTVVYFDFGPPRQSRQDEGILKEKHYAVVLQTTVLSQNPVYPVLVVAGLTSTAPRNMNGWVQIEPTKQNGLSHVSYLDARRLYTIRKAEVLEVMGKVEKAVLFQAKEWLKKLFEITV